VTRGYIQCTCTARSRRRVATGNALLRLPVLASDVSHPLFRASIHDDPYPPRSPPVHIYRASVYRMESRSLPWFQKTTAPPILDTKVYLRVPFARIISDPTSSGVSSVEHLLAQKRRCKRALGSPDQRKLKYLFKPPLRQAPAPHPLSL